MEKRDPLKEVANTTDNNDLQENIDDVPKQPEGTAADSSDDKENGFAHKGPKSDPDLGCGSSRPKEIKPRRSILKAFDPLYKESPEKPLPVTSSKPDQGVRQKLIIESSEESENESPAHATDDVSDDDDESFVDASTATNVVIRGNELPENSNLNLSHEELLLKFYTPERVYVAGKGSNKSLSTSESAESLSVLPNIEATTSSDDQPDVPEEPSTTKGPDVTESEIVSAISKKLGSDCDIIPTRSKFTITESEIENYNILRERLSAETRGQIIRGRQESAADAIEINSITSIAEIRNVSPDRSVVNLEREVAADRSLESTATEEEQLSESRAASSSEIADVGASFDENQKSAENKENLAEEEIEVTPGSSADQQPVSQTEFPISPNSVEESVVADIHTHTENEQSPVSSNSVEESVVADVHTSRERYPVIPDSVEESAEADANAHIQKEEQSSTEPNKLQPNEILKECQAKLEQIANLEPEGKSEDKEAEETSESQFTEKQAVLGSESGTEPEHLLSDKHDSKEEFDPRVEENEKEPEPDVDSKLESEDKQTEKQKFVKEEDSKKVDDQPPNSLESGGETESEPDQKLEEETSSGTSEKTQKLLSSGGETESEPEPEQKFETSKIGVTEEKPKSTFVEASDVPSEVEHTEEAVPENKTEKHEDKTPEIQEPSVSEPVVESDSAYSHQELSATQESSDTVSESATDSESTAYTKKESEDNTSETQKPDTTAEANEYINQDEDHHLDSGVDSIEESYIKSPKSQVGDSEDSEVFTEKQNSYLPDELVVESGSQISEGSKTDTDDESKVLDEPAKPNTDETKLINEATEPEVDRTSTNLTDSQKSDIKASSDIDTIKAKMADLSEKLSEQQQENSDLKLQLNAIQQAKASLELEIRQKEEVIIKTQAEALKNEQSYKQEIKQLREKLKENSKLIEKDGSKELEDQLKEARAREAKAVAELNQRTKDDLNYQKIMEEYENTIATRFSDYQKLKDEHETATRHLANIELAFSDVHQKYERTKALLEGFKSNEDALNAALQASEKTCKQHEERYESLKAHAKGQIEKSNKEILMLRDKYEMDINKLKAIIKRLEIKCSSLEVSLQQKTEECAALSALCDEVTGKKV